MSIQHTDKEMLLTLRAKELESDEYYFESTYDVKVKVGAEVKAKQILARDPDDIKKKVISLFP